MKQIKVDEKYDGKKLNTVILKKFPNLSQNTLNKALRKKDIRINDVRTAENVFVHTGDIISIYIVDELLNGSTYFDIKNLIVFEDENILVLNKPQNICVTKESENEISLVELCQKYANGTFIPKPCHRLDRNTTGLVIFAKTSNALDELLNCFKQRDIEKHYLCLVSGHLNKKTDTLTAYLFKDAKKNIVNISDNKQIGYDEIKTKYIVLEEKIDNTSLLEIELLTGKTHQIRAHLAHIGHPIIGDGKYGIGTINKQFKLTNQQLCAYKLIFHTSNYPILKYLNNKIIEIKCNF